MEKEATAITKKSANRWAIFDRAVNGMTVNMMETLDGFGYLTTGFSFLIISMVVFGHAWYTFSITVAFQPIPALLMLMHDLLLVIILLELFRTIINFLKTKVITLEPFLYICVIASTRRILTTGAQIGHANEVSNQEFERYLLDLGANVLVIVALVGTVYLAHRVSRPTSLVNSDGTSTS